MSNAIGFKKFDIYANLIIISDVSWDGKVHVGQGIFKMFTAMTRKDGSVLYLCFVPVL